MKQLFLFIFIFISTDICAQIGGISGSKINALNHTSIPKGNAEFEPNYSISHTNHFWDNNGKKQPLYNSSDSVLIETSMSFRLNYAFTDNLEVGTFIANSFSNWSVKYGFLTQEKIGLGFLGGFNLPYGMAVVDRKNRQVDQLSTYILGIAGSFQFTTNLSLDINIQHQDYIGTAKGAANSDLFIYADLGQYIGDSNVQVMNSFSYQFSQFDSDNSSKFTFYPGVSLEMKSNYGIAINGSFDLFGKNIEKTNSFAIAWTITF